MIAPWLEPPWRRLAAWGRTPPHALLVRGRPGLGKTALARAYAKWLLCESSARADTACGECEACQWFEQGNHPDFRQVEPEFLATDAGGEGEAEETKGRGNKPSRQIKIDQVRALQDFLAVGTHRAGLRVAIVRPAEAMNQATANALLKSLEEPPPATVFLLVSSQPARLLPTILSRCQAITVAVPQRAQALAWLESQGLRDPEAALAFAGDAPLEALESGAAAGLRDTLPALLAGDWDPLAVVDRLQAEEPVAVVDALQKWVYDAGLVRTVGRARYFPRAAGAVGRLAQCSPAGLAGLGRTLARARAVASHPLNPRLFMESLFLELARVQGCRDG
ncbi:MAG: DNA polymerase III subunit delta' [Burkholderiales bacterium]|nr:DNA polymerase III subunit delta' [Burkholderiales bacterium]